MKSGEVKSLTIKDSDKVRRLMDGKTFITKAFGNSMVPLIKSGQLHIISPCKWEDCKKGDIVYCKVNGKTYTHLVKKKSQRGVLIGNNHGKVNGWTKKVYGRVAKGDQT